MRRSPCGGSVWLPQYRVWPSAESRSSALWNPALDTDTYPRLLPLYRSRRSDSSCSSASDAVGSVCSARVHRPAPSAKCSWHPQPYAMAAAVPGIAPHALRRSCAKMCRAAGGELEQIQLLLGHASVQTTERYLGTKQDLVHAPNDGIKLRVAV